MHTRNKLLRRLDLTNAKCGWNDGYCFRRRAPQVFKEQTECGHPPQPSRNPEQLPWLCCGLEAAE